jgi:uncharacterized protein (DUF697 family)/GTP-binding protein EngB required for normal cell division
MKKDLKADITRNDVVLLPEDNKINVLVMGVSGAGKSTLINSILDKECADPSTGVPGTKKMAVYENDQLPFRLIDTVGYEFGLLRQAKIRHDITKWSNDSVRKRDGSRTIHAIWFCIDSHGKRVFIETLDYLHNVSKIWKDIPIIVVFTKAYSLPEMEESEQMFNDVLSRYKRKNDLNINSIVHVVAKEYIIGEDSVVAPRGLDELIEKTNAMIPDAKRLNEIAVRGIDLKLKRIMAHGLVAGSVTGATIIGAVPVPIPDSSLLVPLQSAMLYGIGKTYKISDRSAEREVVNTIIKVGATTVVAKTLLTAIKAIPGLTIAASVLNAIVAGTITFIAGEICITVFEKVRNGELDLNDTDVTQYITDLFGKRLPAYGNLLQQALNREDAGSVLGNLAKILGNMFMKM